MARRHINKEQVIQRICDALKAGNLRKAAARYAGINPDTFFEWLKDPELSDRIEEAEAQAQVYHATNIRRAADKDWKASAWWMQHYPGTKNEWKPIEQHEHSGTIEYKKAFEDWPADPETQA